VDHASVTGAVLRFGAEESISQRNAHGNVIG
jgi:hypothetical protein